jgi:hypothetical protein
MSPLFPARNCPVKRPDFVPDVLLTRAFWQASSIEFGAPLLKAGRQERLCRLARMTTLGTDLCSRNAARPRPSVMFQLSQPLHSRSDPNPA